MTSTIGRCTTSLNIAKTNFDAISVVRLIWRFFTIFSLNISISYRFTHAFLPLFVKFDLLLGIGRRPCLASLLLCDGRITVLLFNVFLCVGDTRIASHHLLTILRYSNKYLLYNSKNRGQYRYDLCKQC